MGSPSNLHEERVAALRALGFLAGHTVDFRLGPWLRPDVALRDPNRLRLFVADAKATEDPADVATRSRLRSYASALVPWRRAGFDVRFALAVQQRDCARWAQLAKDLAPEATSARWANLTGGDAVVWIDLRESVGARRYAAAHDEIPHRGRYVLRGGRPVRGAAPGWI